MHQMSVLSTPKQLLTVAILDHFNCPQPLYTFRGHYIVKAVGGQQFKIGFIRNTGLRVNVAAGVDGRSTQEDRPFNLSCSGLVYSGYSLGYELIEGFGEETTRSFRFANSVRNSLAYEITGDLSMVGLIEVVAWAEYVPPRPQRFDSPLTFELFRGESTAKSAPSGAVGTEMGDEVKHHVIGHTTFKRALGAPDVVRIYPRATWWLEANGLLSSRPQSDPDFPTSFPGQRNDTDYFRGNRK